MKDSKYIGDELSIFQDAVNWKNYWLNTIIEFISGDVLEVGAGIGVNTKLILENQPNITSIVAIEPDKSLADQILNNITKGRHKVTVLNDYLENLPDDKLFDTILYIDVIEHIADDLGELEKAKLHLKKNGFLIILVPAFNTLFSPFDVAVGHHRRYNRKMLCKVIPDDLVQLKIFYLDSLGVCASLMNKFILKQSYPTKKQILKYDRMIVPISRIMDRLMFHSIGKSLVGIWKK
jgi:SAM-dependent methyltransferase